MREFTGYMHGIGIGGWLTNYKRVILIDEKLRDDITVGDWEHFDRYITREDVKRIKAAGFDHVRLAFDQLVVQEDAPPCDVRERGLQYLDRFLEWSREEGLNVILNCHKAIGAYCDCPGGNLLGDEVLQQRFIKMWADLEKRYHDYEAPFEILNEVSSLEAEAWNRLAERTLKAIRELNPNRIVIIGSAEWNRVLQLKNLKIFHDENVVYTYHFYDPDIFTHQRGVLRPNYAYYNREIHYPGPIEPLKEFAERFHEREYLYEGLDTFDASFIEKNLAPVDEFIAENPDVRLYFGEFGTIRHMPLASRENWMEDLIAHAKKRGIAYCVWNYLSTPYDGNRFSLVDDDSREFLSERLCKICAGC